MARPRALSGLDGSGKLLIENVGGDVIVTDGSGNMDVRNVTGSFTVVTDGSGSIYATDIPTVVAVAIAEAKSGSFLTDEPLVQVWR